MGDSGRVGVGPIGSMAGNDMRAGQAQARARGNEVAASRPTTRSHEEPAGTSGRAGASIGVCSVLVAQEGWVAHGTPWLPSFRSAGR